MIEAYFQNIVQVLESHPYVFIFIGLLFAGETVLLPAVYFAMTGKLELPYVIAVALPATITADLFWYWVGVQLGKSGSRRFLSDRTMTALEKISGAFYRRASLVLYLSKFVYGTRIATHVLAGLKRMKLRTYLGVNFLGSLSLIALIAFISYSANVTASSLGGMFRKIEVVFLLAVLLLAAGHFVLGIFIKKTWSQ